MAPGPFHREFGGATSFLLCWTKQGRAKDARRSRSNYFFMLCFYVHHRQLQALDLLRSGIVSHLSHIRNLAAFDLPSFPAQTDKAMHAHPNSTAVQPRWRAILRLALGQAQIVGATITLVFLLQGGVSVRTIWGVILTGLVTLISILLFRLVWSEKPKG